MTFAILTDSTADLDQNWAKEHQVTILGLTIELDGTVYQTVGEAQLTSPKLLEAMKNGAKPTTSQVMWANSRRPLSTLQKKEHPCFMWPFHRFYQGLTRVQSWHETWF